MPGFERAATIDRPRTQVFAVLDDLHGAKAWMPSIRGIEVLTPGMPVGVGFRWRETRRVFGILRMKAELRVVEHQPPQRWGLLFDDGKMRASATFELTRAGTGTLITMRQEVEDLRGRPKAAERMAKWIEKADDDLLLRLKAHVESRPAEEDPEGPADLPADVGHTGWSAPSAQGEALPPHGGEAPASKPASTPRTAKATQRRSAKPAKAAKAARKPAKKAR